MHRMFWKILSITLLMSAVACGQSLGDIARENREKQNAADQSSTSKPKVITNKDLPKDPNPAPSATTPETEAASGSKTGENRADDHRFDDHRFAGQRQAEQRAADQWQRQIVAQRNKVATLQARIDQIHAAIRAENGNAQFEGPVNSYQARQLLLASQIQQRLNENRRKLEQMQEAARHAGMRTTVYDP
ncbi:MAG: hypothetical protein WBQ43_08720 [Terriglobales bacterium]